MKSHLSITAITPKGNSHLFTHYQNVRVLGRKYMNTENIFPDGN